jgi:hypothetical protein
MFVFVPLQSLGSIYLIRAPHRPCWNYSKGPKRLKSCPPQAGVLAGTGNEQDMFTEAVEGRMVFGSRYGRLVKTGDSLPLSR